MHFITELFYFYTELFFINFPAMAKKKHFEYTAAKKKKDQRWLNN